MIQTTEVSITYKGDGVQTSFPYPYPYRNSDDIVGYIINDVGYEKRITNNFKYDKVSNIYQYPLAGEPLAAPYSIKLIRETPQQQNADLPGKLPFSLIEKSLDWIIMILQEIGSRCNSLWHIRNDCKLSETNARNSASAAAESEEKAANSEDMAKKWAMSPVSPDGVVDTNSPTGYTQSAKIWAALSKEYAGLSKFKLPIGYYNSVAEMRASETAIVGRTCVTLGYYEPNDGGGAIYVVRSKADSDTDDGGSIIVLDNGNVSELLIDGAVAVKQFGAKGDGVHDDTNAFPSALSLGNNMTIIINHGEYKLTSEITLKDKSYVTIKSTGGKLTFDTPILSILGSSHDIKIQGVIFNNIKELDAGKDVYGLRISGEYYMDIVQSPNRILIEQCTFIGGNTGMLVSKSSNIDIVNCTFAGQNFDLNIGASPHIGATGSGYGCLLQSCLNTRILHCRFRGGTRTRHMIYVSQIVNSKAQKCINTRIDGCTFNDPDNLFLTLSSVIHVRGSINTLITHCYFLRTTGILLSENNENGNQENPILEDLYFSHAMIRKSQPTYITDVNSRGVISFTHDQNDSVPRGDLTLRHIRIIDSDVTDMDAVAINIGGSRKSTVDDVWFDFSIIQASNNDYVYLNNIFKDGEGNIVDADSRDGYIGANIGHIGDTSGNIEAGRASYTLMDKKYLKYLVNDDGSILPTVKEQTMHFAFDAGNNLNIKSASSYIQQTAIVANYRSFSGKIKIEVIGSEPRHLTIKFVDDQGVQQTAGLGGVLTLDEVKTVI